MTFMNAKGNVAKTRITQFAKNMYGKFSNDKNTSAGQQDEEMKEGESV